MCIRDSRFSPLAPFPGRTGRRHQRGFFGALFRFWRGQRNDCLLYTSDAADERSSVDLGGRRIIKKKKNTDVPSERDGTKMKSS